MKTKLVLLKKMVAIISLIVVLIIPLSNTANAAPAIKDKAIIIIPGIAGSDIMNTNGQLVWLYPSTLWRMSELACDETGQSNDPYMTYYNDDNYGAGNTAKKIYDELKTAYGSSREVIFFAYDWRKSCADAANRLTSLINNYGSKKVILVAHSMGGLVASKSLVSASVRSRVEKFISIGTPYLGAVKALHIMETGNFIPIIANIGLYANTIKSLACNFPSIYELLPTNRWFSTGGSEYINNQGSLLNTHSTSWSFMKTRSWGRFAGTVMGIKPMFDNSTVFHNSLVVGGNHIANITSGNNKVNTYKIYGKNKNTITRLNYANDGTISLTYTNAGDGTVLVSSATNGTGINGYQTYGYNASHLGILKNTDVISKIKNIINANSSTKSGDVNNLPNVINEKGWIIGPDCERINILAYNIQDFDIFTEKGEPIICENETLYHFDEKGNIVEDGTRWSLGEDSYQLALYNGKYIINIVKAQIKYSKLKIEYMDSGYYTKSVTFNISENARLYVDEYDSKKIECYINDKQIQPTDILSQESLNNR